MTILTPAQVFRKFVTAGVSESGAHEPVKSEIVQLLDRIEQSSSAGIVVRQTKAALDAVTPGDENAGGWVLNDSTAGNNGYYYRSAGAWVKGRGFPDTFARITLAGTANAQTGTVGSGVNPADIEVYYAVVTTANTGPMTLSISGETARDVVNAAGNALSAGEWTGTPVFFLNGSGQYQFLINPGAEAAAAQSATDAAASAQAAADAAAGAGVTDGDKGDITVSGAGTSWGLNAGSVGPDELAGEAVTDEKVADTFKAKIMGVAADRDALAAMSGATYLAVDLMETGRKGLFLRNSADVSGTLLGPAIASSAVNSTTDVITSAGHLLRTGNAVVTTTAVNGLALNTIYYVIRVDDDDFKLASSYANAVAGTAIDLTAASAVTVKKHIDPARGVYVCPTSDVSGASGAWVRQFDGPLNVKWWGAGGGTALLDRGGIQAAIDFFDGHWPAAGVTFNERPVRIPAGMYLIDPALPVEPCDHLRIFGDTIGSSILKPSSTASGSLVKRAYNGTATGNPRVENVEIAYLRGIATGQNQVLFDLQHIGRLKAHHLRCTTQDREDEAQNANQQYWPGSVGIKLGVGDSAPNGYISGTDVVWVHDIYCQHMDFGVGVALEANQKAPEFTSIRNGEISDCHQSIVVSGGEAMLGYIGHMVVQRWGLDSISAVTGLAGADNYGIDYVGNKWKLECLYTESDSSAFASVLTRSGTSNIVDTTTWNRYGTTTTLHSDGGTTTVVR